MRIHFHINMPNYGNNHDINLQEAQLMLTNLRDAFKGQSGHQTKP